MYSIKGSVWSSSLYFSVSLLCVAREGSILCVRGCVCVCYVYVSSHSLWTQHLDVYLDCSKSDIARMAILPSSFHSFSRWLSKVWDPRTPNPKNNIVSNHSAGLLHMQIGHLSRQEIGRKSPLTSSDSWFMVHFMAVSLNGFNRPINKIFFSLFW